MTHLKALKYIEKKMKKFPPTYDFKRLAGLHCGWRVLFIPIASLLYLYSPLSFSFELTPEEKKQILSASWVHALHEADEDLLRILCKYSSIDSSFFAPRTEWNNQTPLTYAAGIQNEKAIQILLGLGANARVIDLLGSRPIDVALGSNPDSKIVTTLSKYGVDAKESTAINYFVERILIRNFEFKPLRDSITVNRFELDQIWLASLDLHIPSSVEIPEEGKKREITIEWKRESDLEYSFQIEWVGQGGARGTLVYKHRYWILVDHESYDI